MIRAMHGATSIAKLVDLQKVGRTQGAATVEQQHNISDVIMINIREV